MNQKKLPKPKQTKKNLKSKDSDDQDFFLYNSFQDDQEAIKVVFGSTKNDCEQNHWYSHG